MANLDLKLLPWQQEVMQSHARFKVIAAGRRTGKSYLAAISLILKALDDKDGKTFYDIPWEIVEEYGIADVLATEQIALKQLDAFGITFEDIYNERLGTDTQAVA